MSDESVERFLRVFVIVPLSGEAHAHAVGYITNAGLPNLLVELRVNAHIGSAHHLRGELANHFNRTRRLPLEPVLAQLRVQVNGVLACHHLGSFRLTVFRLFTRRMLETLRNAQNRAGCNGIGATYHWVCVW